MTTDWLLGQPNVADAVNFDRLNITIILRSGLQTSFSFVPLNDSGFSVYRGYGGGTQLKDLSDRNINSILSNNKISNKKVLMFAARATEFGLSTQLDRIQKEITNSDLGLEVTVLKDAECSYGVVETFKDYGLVIMDTHGLRNSFVVGSTLNLPAPVTSNDALKTSIDAQAGPGTSSKIETGALDLGLSIPANPKLPGWQKSVFPQESRSILFSSKYLDLLGPMSNTVIFGNMCYSGWTASSVVIPTKIIKQSDGLFDTIPGHTFTINGPIGTAFLNRHPISYYGYVKNDPPQTSRAVHDSFAKIMEDSLIHRFIDNHDSTQIADLKVDNSTEYIDPTDLNDDLLGDLALHHFGADDYSYEKDCIDTFTDARDGQLYHAVCIGGQTWMAQNLNYNAPGSLTYNNDPSNGAIYGRLYDWTTLMQGASATSTNPSGVQGVCPKGWHVPSTTEYQSMVGTLGGSVIGGGAMKAVSPLWNSPNSGATNTSGFSGLPGGIALPASFSGLGDLTQFATSSQNAGKNEVVWVLSSSDGMTGSTTSPLVDGNSCRCVKDK